MLSYILRWKDWFWSGGIVVGSVLLALAAHAIIFGVATRLSKRRPGILDDLLVKYGKGPARAILPLLALTTVIPFLPLPGYVVGPLHHSVGLGLIAAMAWLALATVEVFEGFVTARHAVDVADNLTARRIRTQVQVLHHIIVMLVIVVTLSVMLMTFPSIRHVGESLFASAGLAALAAGLAAKSTLSSLVAGVQIALTQPIRLDDVVIVEGEWGWVEEITTTYVIVRIWDLRRLVLPLSYFIEKPFQNWTRQTADILGTVFLYTDYTVPVEEVRQEVHRILEASGMWDGKVWNLQVTDAKDHVIELRALMSAPNGGKAWDLRCHVREKLIEFMQRKYPQSLPRVRAELDRGASDGHNKNGARALPEGAAQLS
jgi:small-conductance mechanosensitive channel